MHVLLLYKYTIDIVVCQQTVNFWRLYQLILLDFG